MKEVAPEPGLCREELRRVLSSRTFRNAPALSKILSFICNKHLDDVDANITEWSIALDALGRKLDFDPAKDSIVRVEFHLLRKRLAEFYANEGAVHPVRIVLTKTGYAPRFVLVHTAPKMPGGEALPSPDHEHRQLSTTTALVEFTREETVVPLMPRYRWTFRITPAIVIALSVALIAAFFRPAASTSSHGQEATAIAGTGTSNGEEIRILAGMSTPKYIDTSGRSWSSDAYGTGGTVFTRPDRQIAGTLDQQMYKQGRQDDFRYDIPLDAGTYELRLFFAETEYGQTPLDSAEAQRRFNVSVNGRTLLENFDVSDDARGPNIAVPKVFSGVTPAQDGHLHIAFSSHVGQPILNALEIVPDSTGKPLPVRILCSMHSAFDREGHLWLSDSYFHGGRQNDRGGNFTGTDDISLYSSARFGHFTYAIPVAPGYEYKATLHFVDASINESGKRLFNVFCNGLAVLTNFDVVKASGGQNHMYRASFDRLRPSAQDKLVFTFEPVRDYAVLRAIEVEPD